MKTLNFRFLLVVVLACSGPANSDGSAGIPDNKTKDFLVPTYFQYQYGFASDSDFGVAILFYYEGSQENTYSNTVSAGWALSDNIYGWPAEVTFFTALQVFDEKGLQPDSFGASFYPKIYKEFRLPYLSFNVRAGLGIGLSYVSRIPVAEARDFDPKKSEKLVVYIDYTLQVSVAQMLGRPSTGLSASLQDIYFGYAILHRSTAFGTFAETGGGINYLGLGLEFVFR